VLAFGFAQRRPLQLDAVGAVDQAVADGVGEGGVADDLVPGLDGELAGDEGRSALVAVLDDLQEVAALLVLEGSETPVVDDEQLGAGQAGEEPAVGAVASGDGEFLIQTRGAQVLGGEAGAAGALGEGAGGRP